MDKIEKALNTLIKLKVIELKLICERLNSNKKYRDYNEEIDQVMRDT